MTWISDPVSDMLADSVAATNLRLACDPNPALGPPGDEGPDEAAAAAAAAEKEKKDSSSEQPSEVESVLELLKSIFGDAELHGDDESSVVVRRDGTSVTVSVETSLVRIMDNDEGGAPTANPAAAELLRSQVETAIRRLARILRPLDLTACC